MECLFTIIIPVHNAEKYISACLQSLLNQTNGQFQVIIIDDASTDNSLNIIKPYLDDKRFELIQNSENLGAAKTRNIGIQMIKGKYVQFLDADDYLIDSALEEEALVMQENDLQMCFLRLLSIYPDKCLEIPLRDIIKRVYSGDELLAAFVRNRSSFLYCCGAIYDAQFVRKEQLKFQDLRIGEGGLFILSALLVAKRVSVMHAPTYCYRQHQDSISKCSDARIITLLGQMHQYLYAREQLDKHREENGLVEFLNYQYGKIRSGLLNLSLNERGIIGDLVNSANLVHLCNIIFDGEKRYNTQLSENAQQEIISGKPVIVFGCGYATLEVLQELSKYNAHVVAIATSRDEGNHSFFLGHEKVNIYKLVELKNKAIVIVGVNIKYKDEIEKELLECGFDDYEFLEIRY